jgi:multicomponent K+:H+ antiporter subunit E
MSRLLPAPVISIAMFATWILLNGISAGHLLLGAALALILPPLVPALRDAPALRLHAPGAMLRLAGVVLLDIVLANIDVARRVLGPESRIHPGYVRVPLALHDPRAITVLASIITLTPGTLSAALEDGGRTLLVHCFHLDDPEAIVSSIKSRYEAPLARIFADAAPGGAA